MEDRRRGGGSVGRGANDDTGQEECRAEGGGDREGEIEREREKERERESRH